MDCSTAIGSGAIVCIVQPFDWRIYIAPALVLISIIVALRAIGNARQIAREKATIDLIEKTESTEHYRAITETFTRLRRGQGFMHLVDPAPDQLDERRAVMHYLNHYELIALAIARRILDEQFYRRWMRGPFVRDWNAAAPFIQRLRWDRTGDGAWKYYPDTFSHFGGLAARWSPDAVTLSKETSAPPAEQDAGLDDASLPAPPDRDQAIPPQPAG